ncbi:hypothetical protein K466DRAFT_511775, partial [Polyporus arcularius HHB13444]
VIPLRTCCLVASCLPAGQVLAGPRRASLHIYRLASFPPPPSNKLELSTSSRSPDTPRGPDFSPNPGSQNCWQLASLNFLLVRTRNARRAPPATPRRARAFWIASGLRICSLPTKLATTILWSLER